MTTAVAASNSFAAWTDFAQMKRTLGDRCSHCTIQLALISVFENAIKAAYKNKHALIPSSLDNFGDGVS